ncbi:hypothetical protein HHL28_14310 [Aerophototrophica crusticola]|uniref:Uncharacterized protein n=1 Tax=Aerophototrophica crusticola TaxID=1709002 RepID=A0A858RAE2_9PROT|nr:hypothetical protein HHL28_14310 [Rhodospirillaceae bacterium B3]
MSSDEQGGGAQGRPIGIKADEFVPATFAERGIAVPFTTPLLSQARLRLDSNERFEFLLPNFTGGKGIYVVPTKSLSSIMTITLHDRLLLEELGTLEGQSPEQVRQASLTVQASGVCGPDAANAAAKAIEQDQHYLVLTQFVLVTELLKLVGIGAQDLMRPGMTAEQSQNLARRALGKVAAQVGISADEMTNRVETLGIAVAPVGLPQSPQPGRLRALNNRLAKFCQAVERWSDLDPSDVALLGRYVAQVGLHTLTLAKQRITLLDKACADPKQIVHDEPRLRGAIVEQVSRVSWLLDGWDFLVTLWESVADKPQETQQATMTDISRLVPVLPREEVTWASDALDMDAIAKVQRRWVRVNEDWRTGSLDMDAVMRIEALKSVAA